MANNEDTSVTTVKSETTASAEIANDSGASANNEAANKPAASKKNKRWGRKKKAVRLVEDDYQLDNYHEQPIKLEREQQSVFISDISRERDKKMQEQIRDILINQTKFKHQLEKLEEESDEDGSNKKLILRKPSKEDFNNYFKTLVLELKEYDYSLSEIFYELAGYFFKKPEKMIKELNKENGCKLFEEFRKSGRLPSDYKKVPI